MFRPSTCPENRDRYTTLSRLADRYAGGTLGSLGSNGVERLLDRFTETLEESFCAKLR